VPTAGFEPTCIRFRKPALCPLSYAGGHGDIVDWSPRRESNSHPQLRKLALCPLSYEGMAAGGRPWQDLNLQPPVPETSALSVALQGLWGDRRELNPSTAVSQTAVLPLHHDRQALLRKRRDSNPQPGITAAAR
jgi:hypothetical protein